MTRRRRRGARAVFALVLVAALAVPVSVASAAGVTSVNSSPLAANGFASPSCTAPALEGQLSAAERTNCSVSGVAVAPVPLANYGVDVNIPSGLGASFHEDIDSVVEDLFVTPIWTAVVWLDHVALIALEWCYSLDLLAPATLSRAASVLGAARRVFTDPWLGLALAAAAAAFAWQGLVRRRVLDTLGQAALLAVMVTAGLWIVADPAGTVGAVGGMADKAALATVAATATGDPSTPVATVDGAFGGVFESAISGPWCYLEFGDVDWCRDPAKLDPRLAADARQLESIYRSEATCRAAPVLLRCAPAGSALQGQLQGAATALSQARSNGQLFLALPPDAISRTSLSGVSAMPGLYATLCGATDPTGCTAPTAPQAEFRSVSGTWPRVGGLLLIVAGTVGMLLLLGFLALRLLGAALATLLYLMLAPLAVLAPALGEAGRDAFRLWMTRLFGAALAKLVYSVALGVCLLVVSLLSSLDGLGWWTQWLLISVFWWLAFEQRHRLLSLVLHERSEPARRAPLATRVAVGGRTVRGGVEAVRGSGRAAAGAGVRLAETVKAWRAFPQEVAPVSVGRREPEPSAPPWRRELERTRRTRVRSELDAQVARVEAMRGQGHRSGSSVAPLPPRATQGAVPAATVAALEERRERLALALRSARAGGDRRRAISLELRARRVEGELTAASTPGTAGSRLARLTPSGVVRRLDRRELTRRLDRAALEQPATPRVAERRTASLSALAGVAPRDYQRLPPPEQRVVRLVVARELERRRELLRELSPPRRGESGASGDRTGPVERAALRRARQFRRFEW